jgi:hypothetical protein
VLPVVACVSLQLVSEVEDKESDGGQPQMEWVHSEDLVGKLIAKLDPAQDSDVHANAAVALVAFISQQQQMHWSASLPCAPSRFTSSLVAAQSVSALLENLLNGSGSTLEHGLTVLVELVRHATSGSRAADGASSAVVVEVLNRMGDLVEVLRCPPPTPAIVNTTGACASLVCGLLPRPAGRQLRLLDCPARALPWAAAVRWSAQLLWAVARAGPWSEARLGRWCGGRRCGGVVGPATWCGGR